MQVDLEELQPKLKEATIATDALLVQIAKDTEVANEKKAVVEKEASANERIIDACYDRGYLWLPLVTLGYLWLPFVTLGYLSLPFVTFGLFFLSS